MKFTKFLALALCASALLFSGCKSCCSTEEKKTAACGMACCTENKTDCAHCPVCTAKK